jgi:hypothetical protein
MRSKLWPLNKLKILMLELQMIISNGLLNNNEEELVSFSKVQEL